MIVCSWKIEWDEMGWWWSLRLFVVRSMMIELKIESAKEDEERWWSKWPINGYKIFITYFPIHLSQYTYPTYHPIPIDSSIRMYTIELTGKTQPAQRDGWMQLRVDVDLLQLFCYHFLISHSFRFRVRLNANANATIQRLTSFSIWIFEIVTILQLNLLSFAISISSADDCRCCSALHLCYAFRLTRLGIQTQQLMVIKLVLW